ncbi:hypothetical protein KXD40_009634 [Peronospora effusa]|nr:hypothetical protein KXD40_009634 [Peronospora effusa]
MSLWVSAGAFSRSIISPFIPPSIAIHLRRIDVARLVLLASVRQQADLFVRKLELDGVCQTATAVARSKTKRFGHLPTPALRDIVDEPVQHLPAVKYQNFQALRDAALFAAAEHEHDKQENRTT